jgi:hypothetical protein
VELNKENTNPLFFRKIINLESFKIISVFGVLYIAIQLITGTNYPMFRDEFYYLACASHLDYGYVDQPPLSAFLLSIWRFFFGDSLLSIRVLPALCGVMLMFVTVLITSEMGGKKFAQVLSALAVMVTPAYLGINGFYSMNCYDLLFWALLLYIIVRIINTGNAKLWITFGVITGIGLMNKISVLFFFAGLAISILFVSERKYLKDKNFWIGVLIALLIFSPYIVWQFFHEFGTIEFMRNATNYKNVSMPLYAFMFAQVLELNPFNAIIWITGLIAVFTSTVLEKYRIFGFMYIIILMIFALQGGKPYYMYPFYPVLISAGVVTITNFSVAKNIKWLAGSFTAVIVISGILLAPLAIPVLQPESFISYQNFIGIKPPQAERGRSPLLPQLFADRFGWKEMTEKVAGVYNSLSDSEKEMTAIYAQNYGEAGAIDYYGKKYGLPPVISGHNNYWLWGCGSDSVSTVIIVGGDLEDLLDVFNEVVVADEHSHNYAMPFESDLRIYIARGLKKPMKEIWEKVRFYI